MRQRETVRRKGFHPSISLLFSSLPSSTCHHMGRMMGRKDGKDMENYNDRERERRKKYTIISNSLSLPLSPPLCCPSYLVWWCERRREGTVKSEAMDEGTSQFISPKHTLSFLYPLSLLSSTSPGNSESWQAMEGEDEKGSEG